MMLLIQDLFVIHGRAEMPFEERFRAEFAPSVSAAPGTTLAGFCWAPHGAGEGYEAIAWTRVEDVPALVAHQERLATGELASCWEELEAQEHRAISSAHVIADWSPLSTRTLDEPSELEHGPTLLRLDIFSTDGPVRDVLAEIEGQHRSSRLASDLLELEACWSPLFGDLAACEVSVLSRIVSLDRLRDVLGNPDPREPWPGTATIAGARRRTRVLRTTSWSPIH